MSVFWKNLNGVILFRMDVYYIEIIIFKKEKYWNNCWFEIIKENLKFNFFFIFVRNGMFVFNNV